MKKNIVLKRESAKIGLSIALALTVGSTFFLKTTIGKQIHLGAGIALVGLSLWHHLLYDKKDTKNKANASQDLIQDRLESKAKAVAKI